MGSEETVVEPRPREGREERVYTLEDVEVRGADDGKVVLAGYASTFNDPYPVRDQWGAFEETILPGAWSEAITKTPTIPLLVGHRVDDIPLAATRAGTLQLAEDTHGLLWTAELNPARSSRHADVVYAVESRAMDEMSVGMRVPPGGDRWSAGNSERWISQANLMEISVLWRGANPHTSAAMRAEEDLLAEIRSLRDQLAEREISETAERHLAGLYVEMARLHKLRYP